MTWVLHELSQRAAARKVPRETSYAGAEGCLRSTKAHGGLADGSTNMRRPMIATVAETATTTGVGCSVCCEALRIPSP